MSIFQDNNWREINIDGKTHNTNFIYHNNFIRSSRYTWLTVIPKNIFEQFQSPVNLWFLYISLLQLAARNINPNDYWTTIIPLSINILFVLIKEAYNDYHRGNDDSTVNSVEYLVWNGSEFEKIKSGQISVGNFIICQNEERVPVDMLLLACGRGLNSLSVDISSIVGIKNLAEKYPVQEIQRLFNSNLDYENLLRKLVGNMKVEEPHEDTAKFQGKIKLNGFPKAVDLTIDNLILKGSVLYANSLTLGLVVYAGKETKVDINIKDNNRKVSSMEKLVNEMVIFILLLLQRIIIAAVVLNEIYNQRISYIDIFENYFSFTMLFSNVIPIMIYVTMSIIRIFQCKRIQNLFKGKILFNTEDINENLGQVEYICADKTGTLTENNLRLKACYVDKKVYTSDDSFIPEQNSILSLDQREIFPTTNFEKYIQDTESLIYKIKIDLQRKNDTTILSFFLKCLALCNSLVSEEHKYYGASADETTLADAASKLGYVLRFKNNAFCELEIDGHLEKYEIIAEKSFNSKSKKSRLLIKRCNEGDYILFVKGSAESMLHIFENQHDTINEIEENINGFGRSGLRTMVQGYKFISLKELKDFNGKIKIANSFSINHEEKIESAYRDLEKGSNLLGITGISDEISPETLETIESLKRAGIKLWILSGDSEGSCLSAALNSGIIRSETTIVKLKKQVSEIQLRRELQNAINLYIYHTDMWSLHKRNISMGTNLRASAENSLVESEFMDDSSNNASPRPEDKIGYSLKSSGTNNFQNLENEAKSYNNTPHPGSDEKSWEKLNIKSQGTPHPNQDENVGFPSPFRRLGRIDNFRTRFFNSTITPELVNFSVICDRVTFRTALQSPHTKRTLSILLFAAKSVCFHDFLPNDKADAVKLIKENFSWRPVVLSIGDGNNDIPMIQCSDIGIGLKTQAEYLSNYSDILVDHFHYLRDLLLVHGHWNYSRMAKSVLLVFYRSFLLSIMIFGYIFTSQIKSVSIFDSGQLIGSEIVFSSIAIIWLGIYDQDIDIMKARTSSKRYSEGFLCKHMDGVKLLTYFFYAFFQGSIAFAFVLGSFSYFIDGSGHPEDFQVISMTLYIVFNLCIYFQVYLTYENFKWSYLISFIISSCTLLGYVIFISSDDIFPYQQYVGISNEISGSLLLWILIFTIPIISTFVTFFFIKIYWKFTEEMQKQNKINETRKKLVTKQRFDRLDKYSECLENAYRVYTQIKRQFQDGYEMKQFSLHFAFSYIEEKYQEYFLFQNLALLRKIILSVFLALILWTLLEAIFVDGLNSITYVRVGFTFGFGILSMTSYSNHFRNHFKEYIIAVILGSALGKFVFEMTFNAVAIMITAFFPSITYSILNVDFLLITILNSINLLLFPVSLIRSYLSDISHSAQYISLVSIQYLIFSIAIAVSCGIEGYFFEFSRRSEFKLLRIVENGVEKTQEILSHLLPAFVRNRVKKGVRYIAEDQGTVTVLFCDICDFDKICKEYSPVELTSFLDSLYQTFDQLCDATGVTKIETVGKTYMACAGFRDSDIEMTENLQKVSHARRAIELGLAMINRVKDIRLSYGAKLYVKIGINSGPVVAGVVGYHKPQFSLVGDTVNTASRMCSTISIPNQIQISRSTYNLIGDKLGLSFIAESVEAKGKGILPTYYVYEDPNELENASPTLISSVLRSSIRAQSLMDIMNNPSTNETNPLLSTTHIESPTIDRTHSIMSKLDLRKTIELFARDNSMLAETLNVFNCKWAETDKQKKYRIAKLEASFLVDWSILLIALIVYFLLLIIAVMEYIFADNLANLAVVIGRVIDFLAFLTIFTLHEKLFLYREFSLTKIGVLIWVIITVGFYIFWDLEIEGTMIDVEIMYIVLILNYASGCSLGSVIWISLLFFIVCILMTLYASDKKSGIQNIIFIIGFSLLNTITIFKRDQKERINHNIQLLASKEIEENNNLLGQMMPPDALSKMKEDRNITDRLFQVTLLYADIVGFTSWSSDKTPHDVVEMLSNLFTRFDRKCVEHNVYKVHTIGDCYVVMGYTGTERRDPTNECMNVISMAQDMIRIIHQINEECSSELNMRIGIHTGEVIAGVIGTNIVRYDIYGPDVLLANKMESGGEPGKINISEATMSILERGWEGAFTYTFNKDIIAKAIDRTLKSYFLTSTN
ncbi:unnamed protein product [Blepharisma stoltei]|uniref:Guanylate cyclase domain-containing protein n=1 Tax=Blepharisma stoltei TaxID=1481888 RepID=A0AAU9KLT0_9CILI|nr:unnamed protein product [Blepharisma stoltei]